MNFQVGPSTVVFDGRFNIPEVPGLASRGWIEAYKRVLVKYPLMYPKSVDRLYKLGYGRDGWTLRTSVLACGKLAQEIESTGDIKVLQEDWVRYARMDDKDRCTCFEDFLSQVNHALMHHICSFPYSDLLEIAGETLLHLEELERLNLADKEAVLAIYTWMKLER